MIEYFTPNSTVTLTEAYLYGTGVVAMAAVYTFTHHPYFFGVMYTGMKVRISLNGHLAIVMFTYIFR